MSDAVSRVGTNVARIGAWLLAVALLLATVYAGTNVRVGLYKWQASRYIDRWLEQGDMPAAPERQLVIESLETALQLRPDDPDLQEKLGTILEWLAIFEDDADLEQDAIDKALAAYRRVVQVRPTWPYGWIKIVSLNMQQQNFGAEFQQAIQLSQRYGPRESHVQTILLQAGLSSWADIDALTRAALLESLALYYGHSPDDVLAVLAAQEDEPALCKHDPLPDPVIQLCGKLRVVLTGLAPASE